MGVTGLRAAFGVTLSAAALLAGLLTVTGCSSSAGTVPVGPAVATADP